MSAEHERTPIRSDTDSDGIVTLTLDEPTGPVNLMNHEFEHRLHEVVNELEVNRDSITGVIIASAKRTFFAGGDLDGIMAYRPEDREANEARDIALKHDLRRLETLGKPVVACINGAAIGGGLEIALAAHRRIASDEPRTRIGLPEVTIGLLPGAGGIVRTTRMLGLVPALTEVILSGKRFTVHEAKQLGLVDEIVPTADHLTAAARAFIAAHPTAAQPWDRPGFELPGGLPDDLSFEGVRDLLPAEMQQQVNDPWLPAAGRALAAAVEGAAVDIDEASAIETRHFVWLATDQVSKNLIKSRFYDQAAVAKSKVSPAAIEQFASRLNQVRQSEAEALRVEGVTDTDNNERVLMAQAIEAVKCLDEGVVASVAEANVLSLNECGFATWAGGALQYITQFSGSSTGFVRRARELEAAHGDRFRPPASLLARAERGEGYV